MSEQHRYDALLSFLCDPRHEERLPQRNNYAWLSGYYRSLLDDITKLLGRSELIAYLEARRALFRPHAALAKAEGRSDE